MNAPHTSADESAQGALGDQYVLALRDQSMGGGEGRLGIALLANFLRLLNETDTGRIKAIVCYNEAVKLLTPASPVLAHLRALATAGVPVIACRTCLEYFALEQQLAVGRMGTMAEIQGLLLAYRAVTP